MRRNKGKLVLVYVLAAAMMAATGCAETNGASTSSAAYDMESSQKYVASGNVIDSADTDESREIAEEDTASETSSADSISADSDDEDTVQAEDESEDGSEDDSALREAENDEKLVYTGSLQIQTLAYEDAAASIRAKIRAAGGFVESESEYDNDYGWYMRDSSDSGGSNRTLNITARIPSDQFESFIDSLEGDGKVISRSVSAENISQIYADTQATKEALEKEEERLLDMMDRAETMEDMISVESRLSEVEQQLNQYKKSLSSMDRDVEYSTVYIDLDEVQRYSDTKEEVSFTQKVRYAAEDAVSDFVEFSKGLVVFVVRYFPFLIILLVVILLLVRRGRRSRRKKRAKKAAMAARAAGGTAPEDIPGGEVMNPHAVKEDSGRESDGQQKKE